MINWAEFGFVRVSAVFPEIKLGQPLATAQSMIHHFGLLSDQGSSILLTAELALTGYSCEDLFHSESLIRESEQALIQIKKASESYSSFWVVGAPLRLQDGRFLNCAWVFHHGKVLGVIPKLFLPNMGEFYERRWFVSGRTVNEKFSHPELGEFWVSPHQVFASGPVRIGIEICHDLWAPREPSTALALKGANVILNLSASNEVVGKAAFRRKLVEVQSQKLHCAYVYLSAGTYESSKDTVFSGHTLFAELGTIVGEVAPFFQNEPHLTVDLDLERMTNARSKDVCYLESVEHDSAIAAQTGRSIMVHTVPHVAPRLSELKRKVEAYPFLAEIPDFEDVIQIQTQGLLRRVESAQAQSLIVGVSGGLDSTHALNVALRTRALSGGAKGKGKLKVIGVTLPGPGTSEKTLLIARTLLKESGVDVDLEVPISEAVAQQMKDLGKSATDRSVVYENTQARQRTQILFNLANEHRGLLVGTGDLSELALGWCTFNADQMAHYSVNGGIPKTVVKGLVGYWADLAASRILKSTLEKILDLPISPELLPPDANGQMVQNTENEIGSYRLHDFFIYHFLNHGYSREKISALAEVAFSDDAELLKTLPRTLAIFYDRFYSQQFKRTTLPPGPKVHSVSLSPRSDFRLPDEIQKRT